jgi:two-component system OmpR family sensor kinase
MAPWRSRGGAGRLGIWRWTIGRELALLVLATLLPFATLVVYWAVEDFRTEQARSQARALRLARGVSADVDQFVADTRALVEAMARVPSVKRGEQPESDQLLAELVEQYPYYESLFVADSRGNVLASGGQDVPPPGNRQAYIGETLRTGGTFVSGLIAPRNTGRYVFVVTTPLWDEGGTPIGIVAASVNLLRLQEGLRRAELPENSSLLVVDRLGRVVAKRSDPEQWVGRAAYDSSAVRSALRLGEGVAEGDFVDGVRRLSGFASAQRIPWVVVVGIPTDEAYGALWRELWRAVALLMLAGAVAGTVAWLLSRRLTRPIGRLAAAAAAYAGGDLGPRVDPAGPEELAALGNTLNRMAAALQRQVAELQAAHQRERQAGEHALAELRRLHSEFIAVAAHELRTPVAAAKSYAELLLRDEVDLTPGIRRQALLRLDTVCERLARLVRSLLGASRIQAGRLTVQCEPVDLAALAGRVVDDVAAYTPSHELRLLPRAGHTTLALADPERVEDVLVNLLANAAKYAPANTVVQVHVLAHAAAPGAEDTIEVRVTDHGPGIPPEEQAAVFERFRRGQGVAASGVGLGLYISQAYVQAMGGTIGVRSTPGHGATFWFRLPAVARGTVSIPATSGVAV